jgi:transcriptional regulator with XRE-family HTH domain
MNGPPASGRLVRRAGVEVISANGPARKTYNPFQHRSARNALASHVSVKGSTADLNLRRKGRGADTMFVEIRAKLHGALDHHNGERPSSPNHHLGAVIFHHFDESIRVPNRIREIRERAGLTQEQLAERVGTTSQQISRLEKGQRGLDVPWMEKIAAALGERPAALIDQRADSASGLPSERKLAQNEEELWLLEAWRALDKTEQSLLKRALNGLAATIPDNQ